MSVRVALIACLLAPLAAPVGAQDNTSAETPAKPMKVHKICRQDVDTGSIMPKNICHTKEEWADIDKQNQANSSQFSDSLRSHSGGLGH